MRRLWLKLRLREVILFVSLAMIAAIIGFWSRLAGLSEVAKGMFFVFLILCFVSIIYRRSIV